MPPFPPRVLLIMPEQWPRALLRAALREVGYDALGAPGVAAALRYRANVPGRGAVGAVVVDQGAVPDEESSAQLADLTRRHGDPSLLLLGRATSVQTLPAALTSVPWRRVIRRPASIADLVEAVRRVLPLPPESIRPLD